MAAAAEVDADPLNRKGAAELIARRARAVVETAVDEIDPSHGPGARPRAADPGRPACATGRRPDDLRPAEPCRARPRAAGAAGREATMTAVPVDPSVGNGARFAARPLSGGGTPTPGLAGRRPQPAGAGSDPVPGDRRGGRPPRRRDARLRRDDGAARRTRCPGSGRLGERRRSVIPRPHLAAAAIAWNRFAGRNCTVRQAYWGLPDRSVWGCPTVRSPITRSGWPTCSTEMLAARPPGTWCAATWRGDGHPDHEAVGRAAATAVERTGAVLVEYPVWMWHWALPGDPDVPWYRAHTVPLDTRRHRTQKRCGAVLSKPVRAGRSGWGAGPAAVRRCGGCSQSERWCSADRATVRRLLRPHVRRGGRSVAAAVALVRAAEVCDHDGAVCRIRGTGTRSNRDVRSVC